MCCLQRENNLCHLAWFPIHYRAQVPVRHDHELPPSAFDAGGMTLSNTIGSAIKIRQGHAHTLLPAARLPRAGRLNSERCHKPYLMIDGLMSATPTINPTMKATSMKMMMVSIDILLFLVNWGPRKAQPFSSLSSSSREGLQEKLRCSFVGLSGSRFINQRREPCLSVW